MVRPARVDLPREHKVLELESDPVFSRGLVETRSTRFKAVRRCKNRKCGASLSTLNKNDHCFKCLQTGEGTPKAKM